MTTKTATKTAAKTARKPRARATRYFVSDGETVRMKDSDGRALKLSCPGGPRVEYREYSDGRAVTTVYLNDTQQKDGRIRGMLNAALNASGAAPLPESDDSP